MSGTLVGRATAWLGTVPVVTTLALALAAISLATPAAAQAASCTDITFIGAAGSGESAQSLGMGSKVYSMYETLYRDLMARGLSVSGEAVRYPADGVSDFFPNAEELALWGTGLIGDAAAIALYKTDNVAKYFASVSQGVSGMMSEATDALNACPGTELVLAGYSQGAMAVHQAEVDMVRDGDANLLNHIAGTLLLGDGDRTPDTKAKLFGSPAAPAAREGLQTYFRGYPASSPFPDVPLPRTTAEICTEGDLVCDVHLATFNPINIYDGYHIHTGYANPLLASAATWLADLISPAAGAIVFSPGDGTAAPPSTLGPFTMTPFASDDGPLYETTSGVLGPTGEVQFDPSLVRLQVANGWETWSNGFTGDVYWTDGGFTETLELPPGTRAFYFYAEPDEFEDFDVDVTADSGASTGDMTVYGDAGAQYFGFYANGSDSVQSITITSPDDFAVGEFGITTETSEAVQPSASTTTTPPTSTAAPTTSSGSGQTGASSGATNAPPMTPATQLSAYESNSTLKLSRDSFPSGATVVELTNDGVAANDLAIAPAAGGAPVLTLLRLAPGATESASVDLPSGTYDVYSTAPGYESKGVRASLTVG